MQIWFREIPKQEGYYWIKHRNGRYVQVIPAYLSFTSDSTHLRSFNNATWHAGPSHGGPRLSQINRDTGRSVVDKSLHFGPKLEIPCGQ